ncbi:MULTISPECIES: DUF2309 domain-containing protein [unclassified Roseitalea]|uniref:YbcC family protein n=1 Tax=unclassified Roseitalea TaxID=2639107 RepID=UPI00273F073A|nr:MULTISPECIES: DUF2309 domain-containing protein [unclassified Roseitalea]
MNIHVSANQTRSDLSMTASQAAIIGAAETATRKIAPLWPLKHFVAVNPFLGLSDHGFADAAQIMARNAGAAMTMERGFYAAAIADGRITDGDLAAALAEAGPAPGLPATVEELKGATAKPAETVAAHPTVADVAASHTGTDWARLAVERVAAWAAGHFDEGQAAWTSPFRHRSAFGAFRLEAQIDRTPEIMGLSGFRAQIAALPEDAHGAIAACAERLGLGEDALDAYFHRLLMSVGGWSAYLRYQVWESELHGRENHTLVEFLAVRLAWEAAIFGCLKADAAFAASWRAARGAYTMAGAASADIAIDCVLQSAFDKAWQRQLLARMAAPAQSPAPARKAVQAAFCIDVRSEVFRRALETTSPEIETIGFAGFFGFPIEYVPLGHRRGGAQCPVLLTPQFTVCEEVRAASEDEQTEILGLRLLRRRAGRAWKSFKLAAVSSFAFVETLGLTYAGKLVTDALGSTRPVPHPDTDGIATDVRSRLGPRITPREHAGRPTGFTDETRVDMAQGVLKAMSMTGEFARLVLLAGHGSTTVNNPHASGLDCGACGGHTGEANARVAAAILNDPAVRIGLAERGIAVPEDTWFLGALHDTTTDDVEIFDADQVPATHREDVDRLRAWLAQAGGATRAERAALLNLQAGRPVDAQVLHRSRDWSQVRPEWGLAGCAAFIAAPRARTAGRDLGGRSFLHSYDWQGDEGFSVLELIMTAPMVVASWISLQYYCSTVDNRVFGSGNKVLHNVVGTLGVLEGNGGDLRTGLPMQSIHDGEKFIHEPLRLNVMIEAPIAAMNAVIERQANVRDLLDNGWLFLFAIDETGAVSHRYAGGLQWTALDGEGEARKAA